MQHYPPFYSIFALLKVVTPRSRVEPLFLYYEEGNPSAVVTPDVFVVKGVSNEDRRTYRLWDEDKGPDVVFELTSKSTRLDDLGTKRALYAMLGVSEYYIFDPFSEYLEPQLWAYHLESGTGLTEYVRIFDDNED